MKCIYLLTRAVACLGLAAALTAPALAAGLAPDTKWPAGLEGFEAAVWDLKAQHQYADIRELCQDGYASATEPEHRAYYLRRIGSSYGWEQDWDQAIPIFKQVIEEYPPSNGQVAWALLDLGEAYIGKSEFADREQNLALAMSPLQQYIEQYPDHTWFAKGPELLGQCYERLGDDQTALGYYLQGAARFPYYPHGRPCVVFASTLNLRLGAWDDAITLAHDHLASYPLEQPAGAHLAAGVGYVGKGDMAAALEEFDRAAAEYSMHVDDSLKEWDAWYTFLYRITVWPQVRPLLEQALGAQPESETAALLELALGRAAIRAGDNNGAVQQFRRVLDEHRDSKLAAEANFLCGTCLMADYPADAIPYFQEVVATDTVRQRIASALGYLATCYSALGDFAQAQAAYTELAAREGVDKAAAGLLAEANALALEKRFDDSIAKCGEVIALVPGSEYAQAAEMLIGEDKLGQAHVLGQEQKRYAESIAMCQEIMQDYPGGRLARQAQELIGHNYAYQMDKRKAKEEYIKVIEQWPGTPEAVDATYYRGLCELAFDEDEAARADFKLALEQSKDDHVVHHATSYYAIALVRLKRYPEARAVCEEILSRPPGDPWDDLKPFAQFTVGETYLREGAYDQAKEAFARLRAVYPDPHQLKRLEEFEAAWQEELK